ncbi:glycoside hydrolase family 70 protein [Apilactobacillus sp. EABW-1NA]|uniref:glycoside hydrolase family 70 protein n=1 Tax=Apilactobacillus sp. EABW-1NA TaxID=2984137 RepID=UPI0025B153FB|nr:glycoside hydrolase family 70 protein [Apilactobacillus sp. EABW-1NA]MDN2612347.1 KxYKxGKxW signal peptide domain-containing protein [Apilactobacillus sp. EABW-1NA]
MNYNQDSKLHYRMYKSGKSWVIAAVVAVTMGTGFYMTQATAHADANPATDKTTVQATVQPTATTTAAQQGAGTTTTKSSDDKGGTATSTVTTGEASAHSDISDSKNTKEYKNPAGTNAANSNGTDANTNNQTVNASNATPVQAPVTGNDSTANQITSNNVTVATGDTNKDNTTSNNTNNTNTTEQNASANKTTTYKKVRLIKPRSFTNSQIKQFNQYNVPVKFTKKYVTNIDGYLTADTWYQPKKIYRNGKKWSKSTKKDFRPILMYWWPTKTVKANYANYFNKSLNINEKKKYTAKSNAKKLTKAVLNIQTNIEKTITKTKHVKWLRNAMTSFIKTQSMWNAKSEKPVYGWGNLQGGSFKYVNSKTTKNANSRYRLLGRAYTMQKKNNYKNYELLLANDIDNSNPAVQAEDLNNFYYLMNISSILGKGSDGNFDGGREDATGSMDYDITQLIENFQTKRFNMTSDAKANAHLNLLEDGAPESRVSVAQDGNKGLTHDMDNTNTLVYPFTLAPGKRSQLSQVITNDWVNRGDDYTENQVTPNYSFLNVHDGVQTFIANIISDISKDNPNAPTKAVLNKAIKIYDQDQFATNKKYAEYNIPAAYSLLLSNKDVVPRVYYGDLYLEGDQYMATKSPYFDSITTMLKDRVKYVSGGQQMRMQGNDILTSVRFGKGDLTPTSTSAQGRLSGYLSVTSNNPDVSITSPIKIYMGADHKNQEYRPELMTTKDGLTVFHNDQEASKYVVKTDDDGYLYLDGTQVFGASNPMVSGYLSTWVPVGASDNQDVRTQASTKKSKDGKTFHSNAALDSHVAYEGFSSLQPITKNNSKKTDVVIAQNASLFKELGITDFEFPGHYMPVHNDSSFVDTTEENGYAFSDRYNLGMDGKSTKYGTVDQLIDANKALHAQGVHTLTDYVMNQLYDLNGQELTTVTRIDGFGKKPKNKKDQINNALYVASTKSSKKDYQYKFGGKFLSMLKKKYPSLFKQKQKSTNEPIDSKTHIKIWSAKYMNGTSIQGKGMGYLLKKNGQYFKLHK